VGVWVCGVSCVVCGCGLCGVWGVGCGLCGVWDVGCGVWGVGDVLSGVLSGGVLCCAVWCCGVGAMQTSGQHPVPTSGTQLAHSIQGDELALRKRHSWWRRPSMGRCEGSRRGQDGQDLAPRSSSFAQIPVQGRLPTLGPSGDVFERGVSPELCGLVLRTSHLDSIKALK
jgi:hypothetical protein